MPKSKSGKTDRDPAKAAADAAYIARAARVMRWVMLLAILATVTVLYFMIEPVVRMAWNGEIQNYILYRHELIKEGETPPPLFDPRWTRWLLTVGGGLFMLILFSALYRALKRLEQPPGDPTTR